VVEREEHHDQTGSPMGQIGGSGVRAGCGFYIAVHDSAAR
jgi:hypothetical protein